MLILGIETSCDETGIALYDSERGLLAHALHTQMAMHEEYGGVVPELASRDHIRRVLPLIRRVMHQAGAALQDIDAVAYTQGPGLAGALLVGTSVANALAFALGIPAGAWLECLWLVGSNRCGAHGMLLPRCAVENNIAGIIIEAGIIFVIVMVAATWYNPPCYD